MEIKVTRGIFSWWGARTAKRKSFLGDFSNCFLLQLIAELYFCIFFFLADSVAYVIRDQYECIRNWCAMAMTSLFFLRYRWLWLLLSRLIMKEYLSFCWNRPLIIQLFLVVTVSKSITIFHFRYPLLFVPYKSSEICVQYKKLEKRRRVLI